MEFKNIVFDIDGTLADTYDVSSKSLKQLLEENNIYLSEEDQLKHYGVPFSNFLEDVNIPYDEKLASRYDEIYTENAHNTKLFDDVIETIKQIENPYIVTSRSRREYLEDFGEYGINSYFKGYVCASDTIEHKPNPDPMLFLLEKYNLKAEETIYIGDTIFDSKCARGADVKFGLAVWGAKKDVDADYYFKNIKDVLEVAKKN